ncbi:MAG: 3'(2'),5'-bisphosphate nucleotidase [Flavobacteriales bacterium]|nr:3'(2'),5'-bisphosphate nucleotidase [Flavobacteriales bacterium]
MSIDLLKIAITAALEASKEILKIYNADNFVVELKADDSPLTKADLLSNQIIKHFLKKTNISIISEEEQDIPYNIRKQWSKLWMVDPIDGTKEFIKRNGEFTVNIALIKNHIPVLGVIYAPVLNELYFSYSKIGAYKASVYLNNYDVNCILNSAMKLPLERKNTIYTIVASRSHSSQETIDFIKKIKKDKGDIRLLNKGSSLKLCLVAEGKVDIYPRFARTMEWDTAAGQAICEHSGFKVIDIVTKEKLFYNKPKLINNSFVVN